MLDVLKWNTFISKLENAWLQNGYVSSKRELFTHCKCLLKLEITFTECGKHINRSLHYVKSLVRNFCKGLSVNWSVSKQYMDFLHSLWACSKRLCFVGPCPVVFFFSLSNQRVGTLSGDWKIRRKDSHEDQYVWDCDAGVCHYSGAHHHRLSCRFVCDRLLVGI